MSLANPRWGAPRIHGELLKLGFDVSERSVSRWIRRAPKDPDPLRRWLVFLRNHREAIAAMDLFTVPTKPEVCRKAPKIDLGQPPAVDLSVAPVARLALGVGHRQARNGRSLASCCLSFVLDLEGALRKTRATRHFKRSPRSDSQDMPGESRLGCAPHPRRTAKLGIDIGQSSVSKYMVLAANRHLRLGAPSWLENHAQQLVSIDFSPCPPSGSIGNSYLSKRENSLFFLTASANC